MLPEENGCAHRLARLLLSAKKLLPDMSTWPTTRVEVQTISNASALTASAAMTQIDLPCCALRVGSLTACFLCACKSSPQLQSHVPYLQQIEASIDVEAWCIFAQA